MVAVMVRLLMLSSCFTLLLFVSCTLHTHRFPFLVCFLSGRLRSRLDGLKGHLTTTSKPSSIFVVFLSSCCCGNCAMRVSFLFFHFNRSDNCRSLPILDRKESRILGPQKSRDFAGER